ncbi:phage tail protein [Klebsiella michiganensis]|uniref:phage tail protein n=1 Tax=Klebsiella michiganensis TaxID=1134687 RepID=UPI0040403A48
MSDKKYGAVITLAGTARLAQAALTGEPLAIKFMAVGDGGGALPSPSSYSTGLVNEKYRGGLNKLIITENDASVIEAEMIMLPQIGGFWLRELALFADDGVCIAVGNMPETYKPLLSEGSGRFQSIRMQLKISSTEDVELIADPSVILATADEVRKAKNEAKDYTDQVVGELDTSIQQAITDAIAAARSDFWEEENPPGTVRFFAQNIDPNEKWPWSEWVYTGENKTIRVGKADGSNVGTTGGSDTVTLQRDNLPAVQIGVSGETSEQPQQELATKPAGRHKHGGVPSRENPWEIGGDISQRFNPANLGETDEVEDHEHDIDIPPHHHDVTGKTDNLGEGQSFSVVEAHTLLMCWARVA